ncbi:hypothetical protein I4U23_027984 [Adineta vaga]|nr:hypothetical protein I4U23_027984 [Adineta vaga]
MNKQISTEIQALKQTIRASQDLLREVEERERILRNSQTCHQPSIEPVHKSINRSTERKRKKLPHELTDKSRLSIANDALIYMKNCEKTKDGRITNTIHFIEEILKSYLDEYINSFAEKLKTTFDKSSRIENYHNTDPSEDSRKLEKNLKQLFSLKELPHVFKCIDGEKKIEHWQQNFLIYYQILSRKLEEYKMLGRINPFRTGGTPYIPLRPKLSRLICTSFSFHDSVLEYLSRHQRVKELQNQLLIAEAMGRIDRSCVADFPSNGYEGLYKRYKTQLIEESVEEYQLIFDYIEKYDYVNVDLHLPNINVELLEAGAMNRVKHDLQSSLDRLLNDIEQSVNYLDRKIEKEEQSKMQISEILDDQTKTHLENFVNNSRKTLSGTIFSGLISIQNLLETNNFLEAEQGMRILNGIQRELKHEFLLEEEVIRKYQWLDEKFKNIENEILQRHNFQDVYKYAFNPPVNILIQLNIAASNGIIAENMNLAIEKLNSAPLNEQITKIRSLNNTLQFLPKEIQNLFRSEIETVRQCTIREETAYREALEICFEETERDEQIVENVRTLAKQYRKQELLELRNQLHEQSLKRLNTYRLLVRNCLKRHEIDSVIDSVKIILKYKERLSDFLPEVKEIFETVCYLIRTEFQKCCQTIAEIATIEQAQIVEEAFSDIVTYLEFFESISGNIEVLFPDNIFQHTIEDFQRMIQFLSKNFETYRTALGQRNILDLYESVIISQKWSTFLEIIRHCRSRHNLIQNVLTETRNITLYRDMIFEVAQLMNNLQTQLNIELINADTIKFERERDELLRNINTSMKILQEIEQNFRDILPSMVNVSRLEKDLEKIVENISLQLVNKASQEELSIQDSDDFRTYYYHLKSIEEYLKLPWVQVRQVLEYSEQQIYEKVRDFRSQMIVTNLSTENACHILIKMKFLAENLSMFDKKINKDIDETLNDYKQRHGILGIMQLVVELQKSDIGIRIISEHSCLTGEDWRRRRNKMQKQDDLEYVLARVSGDDISTPMLRQYYEIFRRKYDELVSCNLKLINSSANHEPDLELLVRQIKDLVRSETVTSNIKTWDCDFMKQVPILLAYIFAVWTLKNTQYYNEMREIEVAQSYLLMPHIGQVIAVFRLLGVGHYPRAMTERHESVSTGKISNSLINNLVEIGTGEGKSVVMAIAACVFALMNIDVNCSCYSEVLSSRDRNEFTSLFQILGIRERIKYGTFNKLCEEFLNEQCDVRDKVQQMILTNQNTLSAIDITIRLSPKVLLIDEVDVFLSTEYYGETYKPLLILNDPPIKALLDAVWKKRISITLTIVKTLSEYKTCTTQYSNWMFLFDEAINQMLSALQTFPHLNHIVRENKIAYIQGKSVVNNAIYGYHTVWAYYYENEKGNITSDSLRTNVGLMINCGEFSYAEMPHEFAYIAGVTGTLRTLAQSEKDILKNVYSVQQDTIMPSVFGESNRTYNSHTDVHIVDEYKYFNKIRETIDKVRNAERPILVFFESEEKLMAFYNSSILSSIENEVLIISERVVAKDRELYIKRSTGESKVTFLTRIFGRGTDFICINATVLANGGVHVFQTFFSKELAEEYQIMGRGARQGDRGSYSMVLLNKDLEWISGSISGAISYHKINKTRSDFYESQCSAKTLRIEPCKRFHQVSKKFMVDLCGGEIVFIKEYLTEQNIGEYKIENPSRTILLISTTSSMSLVLSILKDTICTIYERASVILQGQRLPSNNIQMQFALYRNYNYRENQILQVSSWHSKANDLRAFVDTINVTGRQSDEAIEIGLQHAVKESESLYSVSQVILIGDTLANSKEQVRQKREYYGEVYWKETKFRKATDCASELKRLGSKNIPVHAFYLNDNARESFEEMAKMTRGHCEQLNVCSPMGAKLLTDLITKEVLIKAAGDPGYSAVRRYEEIYM